jgi:hypothetical protein
MPIFETATTVTYTPPGHGVGEAEDCSSGRSCRGFNSGSLRAFVNYDYMVDAPLKIGVASVIGASTGLVGGLGARLGRRPLPAPERP